LRLGPSRLSRALGTDQSLRPERTERLRPWGAQMLRLVRERLDIRAPHPVALHRLADSRGRLRTQPNGKGGGGPARRDQALCSSIECGRGTGGADNPNWATCASRASCKTRDPDRCEHGVDDRAPDGDRACAAAAGGDVAGWSPRHPPRNSSRLQRRRTTRLVQAEAGRNERLERDSATGMS